MIIAISIQQLKELSKNAPADYYEHITKSGTVKNDLLLIDDATYRKLWQHYRVGAEPPPLVNGRPPLSPRAPRISAQPVTLLSLTQPGTLLSLIIKKLTGFDSNRCCRCTRRVGQMNNWGWLRCWRNRKTIITWLAEEARNRGHQIPDDSRMWRFAIYAVKPAFREVRQQRLGKPSAQPLQSP